MTFALRADHWAANADLASFAENAPALLRTLCSTTSLISGTTSATSGINSSCSLPGKNVRRVLKDDWQVLQGRQNSESTSRRLSRGNRGIVNGVAFLRSTQCADAVINAESKPEGRGSGLWTMVALRRVSRTIYGVVSSVPEGGSISPIGLSGRALMFFSHFSFHSLSMI